MTRSISISTDVFAKIWAERETGEDTEDAILRRIFDCPATVTEKKLTRVDQEIGFKDNRHGVSFEKGFEIFRLYKGKRYSASALNNTWVRNDNNKRYYSINQLNESIAAGPENVWNGSWKYRNSKGLVCSINHLRNN